MTAADIRRIDVSHDSEGAKREFALAMLQEIAAQLAEVNSRLRSRPAQALLTAANEPGTLDALLESVAQCDGSIIPYIYGEAPANARRVA